MRTLFIFLFLISNLTSFSQIDQVAGNYALKLGKEDNNQFQYELTLNNDGTFTFHYYSKIINGIPPETHKYGKGSWKAENNLITFFSDKQKDIDEKHTLDFTNSKARFVTKNPRDKTDKIVKTRIKFFESEIKFISTIDMLKL
jgi:hypothetical protein